MIPIFTSNFKYLCERRENKYSETMVTFNETMVNYSDTMVNYSETMVNYSETIAA